MTNWLTKKLQLEIRKVFEPRYNRKLSDKETVEVAENLTSYLEAILQWRWRKSYADKKAET